MGRPPRISRDQLLEAARSVFSQKGYDATTLDEIARAIGVTPAAVLRHVRSKQDLFIEAMATSRHELAGAILALDSVPGEAPPELVLRKLATEMIPFLKKRVDELVVLALHVRTRDLNNDPVQGLPHGPESPPALALASLERYFKRAKKSGTVNVADPKATALLFLGAIQSYVFFQHLIKVQVPPYPPTKFIDALMELWRNGAFTPTPPRHPGGKRGSSKA